MLRWWVGFLGMVVVSLAQAAVKTEEVRYPADGVMLNGFLAYDDALPGKRPAVLVVHEWWGHNEHARTSARKLAEMGYVALAVDMYGDGKKAEHPADAQKMVQEVRKNSGIEQQRFAAALQFIQSRPEVAADQTAAIGYCFGGSVVLNMARLGLDLDGVASFHGSLGTATPALAGKVKTQVLVLTGSDDSMVPPPQIAAFEKEMQTAGVNYQLVVYEGAEHSFTNPQADAIGDKFDLPIAYNAEADAASWKELQGFLQKLFAKAPQ